MKVSLSPFSFVDIRQIVWGRRGGGSDDMRGMLHRRRGMDAPKDLNNGNKIMLSEDVAGLN